MQNNAFTFKDMADFALTLVSIPVTFFALVEIYKQYKPASKNQKSSFMQTYELIYIPLYKLLLKQTSVKNINFETVCNDLLKIIDEHPNQCPQSIHLKVINYKQVIKDKKSSPTDEQNAYNETFKEIYRNYRIYTDSLFKEPIHIQNNRFYIWDTILPSLCIFMIFILLTFIVLIVVFTFRSILELDTVSEKYLGWTMPAYVIFVVILLFIQCKHRKKRNQKYDKEFDEYYKLENK